VLWTEGEIRPWRREKKGGEGRRREEKGGRREEKGGERMRNLLKSP
jgi:hypothetical protein